MGGVISKDSLLTLRFGCVDDVPNVMKFIENHWNSGHVLSRDRLLFEFIYLDNKKLNFVIATETSTGREVAILGFIPTNSGLSRVSLALWKSLSDKNSRSLQAGLASLRFLIQELAPRSLFCVGIRRETTRIYEFMGYSCNVMNHHIIINQEIADFRIIKDPPTADLLKKLPILQSAKISKILSIEEFRTTAARLKLSEPLKDIDYLCHRYFEHPSFKYEICEVPLNSKTVGILVFRRSYANDRSCIRIIDVVGAEECLMVAIKPLIEEMLANGDEYIDLLSWGLNSSALEEIGFVNKLNYPECVVPEYFAPFSQTNVERWLFTNLPDSEKFFKGDGDQDRPN